ncbi:hypothetical protein EDB87DRAFT_1605093, partial [Lactarius vividus]
MSDPFAGALPPLTNTSKHRSAVTIRSAAGSRNPFIMPPPPTNLPRHHDVPPHTYPLHDDDDISPTPFDPLLPFPLHPPFITSQQHYAEPDDRPVIRKETMASMPPWPANLRLSLNANNWLEWSWEVLTLLEMAQLDVYPHGLLICLDYHIDCYMRSHMYSSESQYITNCIMSVEAFNLLHQCHKKCSGLTQIQLIQCMMQVDITRLALLFTLMNIRVTHPSVHEALAPALMDGTIMLEALERCLSFFYEMQVMQSTDQMIFPAMMPNITPSPTTSPSFALPASIPPQANICPNCKWPGHSI